MWKCLLFPVMCVCVCIFSFLCLVIVIQLSPAPAPSQRAGIIHSPLPLLPTTFQPSVLCSALLLSITSSPSHFKHPEKHSAQPGALKLLTKYLLLLDIFMCFYFVYFTVFRTMGWDKTFLLLMCQIKKNFSPLYQKIFPPNMSQLIKRLHKLMHPVLFHRWHFNPAVLHPPLSHPSVRLCQWQGSVGSHWCVCVLQHTWRTINICSAGGREPPSCACGFVLFFCTASWNGLFLFERL